MVKHLLTVILLLISFCGFAQLQPNGTTLYVFPTVPDIKGQMHSVKSVLDSGNHIVFFWFDASSYAGGWGYNSSHILEQYYEAYGPNGSLGNDGRVFMWDVNMNTDTSDIRGTGNHTVGDWTQGNNFPIFDITDFNAMAPFMDFSQSASIVTLPAVFVLCANRKMYEIGTLNTVAAIRDSVQKACSFSTGLNHVPVTKAFLKIEPNPASDEVRLHIETAPGATAAYVVRDVTGKIAARFQGIAQSGDEQLSISTSAWQSGLYFITVQCGTKVFNGKLVVQH